MSERKTLPLIRGLGTTFMTIATLAGMLPVGAGAQTETALYNYPAI